MIDTACPRPPWASSKHWRSRASSRGGRYVSLIGTNAFFHHPGDRWPSEVDVLAVARYARAFAELTLTLTAR